MGPNGPMGMGGHMVGGHMMPGAMGGNMGPGGMRPMGPGARMQGPPPPYHGPRPVGNGPLPSPGSPSMCAMTSPRMPGGGPGGGPGMRMIGPADSPRPLHPSNPPTPVSGPPITSPSLQHSKDQQPHTPQSGASPLTTLPAGPCRPGKHCSCIMTVKGVLLSTCSEGFCLGRGGANFDIRQVFANRHNNYSAQ